MERRREARGRYHSTFFKSAGHRAKTSRNSATIGREPNQWGGSTTRSSLKLGCLSVAGRFPKPGWCFGRVCQVLSTDKSRWNSIPRLQCRLRGFVAPPCRHQHHLPHNRRSGTSPARDHTTNEGTDRCTPSTNRNKISANVFQIPGYSYRQEYYRQDGLCPLLRNSLVYDILQAPSVACCQ